jgi:integrase
MTAPAWPVVTCTACGATGPGRAKAGLCKRCYARAQHPVELCGGCGQTRRRLAAGLCARCYRLSRTRLIVCSGCGQERPVYFGDQCERCKRRAAAPCGACADCGKQVMRLWAGRCRTCHARLYEITGACRDCGDLTKLTSGLCKACRLFRWSHQAGLCPYCGRWQPIGAAGACRSCAAASRAAARARRQHQKKATARPPLSPAGQQLLETLTGYGQARGWSPETQRRARRSLTAVLASGHDLGQPPWNAAAVRGFLISRRLKALRTVEFLTDQGLARDPQDVLAGWITNRLATLPAPFAAEVRIWADALQGCGPRAGRPRNPRTIQGYLRILQSPLAEWAAHYESLRQVTTEDVTSQLGMLTGATRHLALVAMRSLFGTLKTRRVLFTNPAGPLTGRSPQQPPVLTLDAPRLAGLLGRLREPAELILLLAGVHALRPSQICALTLEDTDPAAGTLTVGGGRARPLDQLTAGHLRTWLQVRRDRWPATANPHLLINQSTAGGTRPVTRSYVQASLRRAGITAQDLRADRLLAEARASGGDPLQLTRLFGISDPTAIRYCAEIGVPGQDRDNEMAQHPPGR